MILHTSVCSGKHIPEGKIIPGHLKALSVKKIRTKLILPANLGCSLACAHPTSEHSPKRNSLTPYELVRRHTNPCRAVHVWFFLKKARRDWRERG